MTTNDFSVESEFCGLCFAMFRFIESLRLGGSGGVFAVVVDDEDDVMCADGNAGNAFDWLSKCAGG